MKLQFIANHSARKTSFKRRMKSINKKLDELTRMNLNPYEPQPHVWPHNMGAKNVLAQFMRMSVYKRSKHMVTLEGYIKERIKKTTAELKKLMKKNREQETTLLMYRCLTGKVSVANLNMTGLNDVVLLVDHKLSEINNRIEVLKKLVQEDNMMAGGEQPSVGLSDNMNMMNSPKSFVELLMGPE